MSSLPQRFGSRFFLLAWQASCRYGSRPAPSSLTPPTRFLFFSNPGPAAVRSRLFQTARPRVRPTTKSTPATGRRNASTTPPRAPKIQTVARPSVLDNKASIKSFVDQLAARNRTLLYEAPSHFWYRLSSFAAGAFCITYTVIQYWEVYLHPREGLATWVPHAFGVICIFMTAMGVYFILGTQHIVRSVEAVPTRLLVKRLSPAQQKKSPIYVEVSMQRPLPFLPTKKTLYAPDEIQLPFRIHGTLGNLGGVPQYRQLTMVEEVRAERAAREARVKAVQERREMVKNHILTAPFRDGAKVMGEVWKGVKRPFYREGFAKIMLGKNEYKLDVTGGWALDDGRAMDRLFTIRPSPGSRP